MLPVGAELYSDVTAEGHEILPTRTYKFDFENKRIIGHVDNEPALIQFIRKVLSTDKYAWEIYDWYYGNEIIKLVGKPYEYIVTELPRICKEALLADDRINELTDFKFNKTALDSMTVSFIVHSIYGDIPYTQEVRL